jgi:hypothetical protein
LPVELRAAFAAFGEVLAQVEPAKAALTRVMPTTRLPGQSLPDALMEFEERLGRAKELMPAWRWPETQEIWVACDEGLDEALDLARGMREEAPDVGGFEGLIWAVERLMGPLEPFAVAAGRFRSLRTVAT